VNLDELAHKIASEMLQKHLSSEQMQLSGTT